jgi:hypothetical protein
MLGSKVVVVAASPKTGVNTVTGEGLADKEPQTVHFPTSPPWKDDEADPRTIQQCVRRFR